MLTIRAMTEADVDAVAAIHVRAWRAGYAGIIADDYLDALDVAAFAERHRSRITRARSEPVLANARTVVAVAGSEVVGFASFGPYLRDDDTFDPAMGHLYAIYVHPDHWGRGAGRELISAARAALTEAGFPGMRLWVLEENHRARRFYERAGLSPDGVRQTYVPRGSTQELPELRYATAL